MTNYLLDGDKLADDLVFLQAIFVSKRFQRFDVDKHYILWGMEISREKKIFELLIESAMKLRIIDDIHKDFEEAVELPFPVVGILKKKVNSGSFVDEEQLTFRECCNKIIHAQWYGLDYDDDGVLPTVNFQGMKGKAEWRAEVDIHKFIISGISYCIGYDENWDISSRRSQ